FEDALSASMGLRGKRSGAVGQASSPFAFAGEMQRELWRLWNTAFTRTPGAKSSLKAGRGDKRFKDEAWQEAPYFDLLKQSYLLASKQLSEIVDQAQVDNKTK